MRDACGKNGVLANRRALAHCTIAKFGNLKVCNNLAHEVRPHCTLFGPSISGTK